MTVTATADGYRSASVELALNVNNADGTAAGVSAADNGASGVAIAGLVLGILGLVAAGAAITLVFVKKK